MHVEFWDISADRKLLTAALGPDDTVVFTPEPGYVVPWWFTDPDELPGISDDGHTFLKPSDGERFLRALPTAFRSYVFYGKLIDEG